MKKPNLLFVFADQWRREALGYTGNPDVRTPHIDQFSQAAIEVPNAVSTCPVCTPYRASLLTGKKPLSHGVFTNDVLLDPSLPSIGSTFKEAGYRTAYVGKWHVHAGGRSAPIPRHERMGFDYWKVLECTHDYLNSKYYSQDETTLSTWDRYDAYAQTDDLIGYLETTKDDERPFCAVLSWGPPHAPPPYAATSAYDQYPPELEGTYNANDLTLRPNVPPEIAPIARELLAGYYTHCTALDNAFGKIMAYLSDHALMDDTIVVFTSDHGDLLGSHGLYKKQSPFAEAIDVPFLIHVPGAPPAVRDQIILEPEDIMPSLLSLCGVPIPDTVEGVDLSAEILGDAEPRRRGALIALYVANGQWREGRDGGPLNIYGREYRGIRTERYTYVVDLDGPWLLFDNVADPYQLSNIVNHPEVKAIQRDLSDLLFLRLELMDDAFESGASYLSRWGYVVDEFNSVRFNP
ncbi:MAG: sulfatase [Alkalispirochaeta sp.]